MERATRMLNLLSAAIMIITGLYIHLVFDAVLTGAAKALLWWTILFYSLLQVELSYRLLRKHIAQKWRL